MAYYDSSKHAYIWHITTPVSMLTWYINKEANLLNRERGIILYQTYTALYYELNLFYLACTHVQSNLAPPPHCTI